VQLKAPGKSQEGGQVMLNSKPSGIRKTLSPNRVEALTDGVFAIVMTILVLELGVPIMAGEPSHTELTGRLLAMWPQFLSYFVTFLLLGFMWSVHYYQFSNIRRSDSGLVWLNILFLMFMSLLPFSTSLLGQHIDEQVPILIYGGNFIACVAVRYFQWTYATKNYRLIDRDINPFEIKQPKIMLPMAIGVFIVGICLSLLSNIASICVFAAILIFFIIRTTIYRRIRVYAQPVK
jgi:uncharacterized membrane protein